MPAYVKNLINNEKRLGSFLVSSAILFMVVPFVAAVVRMYV